MTAYFSSLSVPATRQLKLQERTVSTLTNLRYDNATSRASTAVALRDIQVELGRLGPMLTSMRTPGGLAHVGAAQTAAIQQLSIAVGEVAEGLTAAPSGRLAHLENASAYALRAEAESVKAAAHATAATTGVAAAAAAFIPIVGPIIAAILATIAAVIGLIGAIVAQGKEEEAAAQKERARPSAGTRSRGVRWPP